MVVDYEECAVLVAQPLQVAGEGENHALIAQLVAQLEDADASGQSCRGYFDRVAACGDPGVDDEVEAAETLGAIFTPAGADFLMHGVQGGADAGGPVSQADGEVAQDAAGGGEHVPDAAEGGDSAEGLVGHDGQLGRSGGGEILGEFAGEAELSPTFCQGL